MPIFQQGGWFDPYSGSHLRSFAAIAKRVPNRVHDRARGRTRRRSSTFTRRHRPLAGADRDPRPRARFYDRYLKDVDNDWEERPPAELYVLGADDWRGEQGMAAAGHGVHAVATCAQSGGLRSRAAAGRRAGGPLRL